MSIREMIHAATDEEKADALRELMQFPLGQKTFEAWCETGITCPMEYCIFTPQYKNILLYRRPADDPYFAGQYHVTGGVMRPGEQPWDVWHRVTTGHKYGLAGARLSDPFRIGVIDTMKGHQWEYMSPRGQERNSIYISFYVGGHIASDSFKWFDLKDIPREGPERLIGHHQGYLDHVVLPWLGMST